MVKLEQPEIQAQVVNQDLMEIKVHRDRKDLQVR